MNLPQRLPSTAWGKCILRLPSLWSLSAIASAYGRIMSGLTGRPFPAFSTSTRSLHGEAHTFRECMLSSPPPTSGYVFMSPHPRTVPMDLPPSSPTASTRQFALASQADNKANDVIVWIVMDLGNKEAAAMTCLSLFCTFAHAVSLRTAARLPPPLILCTTHKSFATPPSLPPTDIVRTSSVTLSRSSSAKEASCDFIRVSHHPRNLKFSP